MSVDYSVLFRSQGSGNIGDAITRGFEGYDRRQLQEQNVALAQSQDARAQEKHNFDMALKRERKAKAPRFNRMATIEYHLRKGNNRAAMERIDANINALAADPNSAEELDQLQRLKSLIESESYADAYGMANTNLGIIDPDKHANLLDRRKKRTDTDLLSKNLDIRGKELDAQLDKLNLDKLVFEREGVEGPQKMELEKRRVKVLEDRLKLDAKNAARGDYSSWSVDQRDAVNEAEKVAEQSAEKVSKASLLLHDIGLLEDSAGQLSVWGDKFDVFMGTESKRAEYRTKIANFVNKDLLQDLPPGVASDADMIRAEKGYPPEGSHPDAYKRYFQDVVRAAKKAQSYHTAKTSYLSRNQGVAGDNMSGKTITLKLNNGMELAIPEGSNLGKEWENMFGYVEPPEYMDPDQQAAWDTLTRPQKEVLLQRISQK